MNFLSDIITYIRRIIKSPSNTDISDALLIDYINRFWIMDVDAQMQLFDLKTKYSFQTTPGVDQYNMPLYNFQSETAGSPDAPDIGMYPVYQGFLGPAYINGVEIYFQTQQRSFFNKFPNIVQNPMIVGIGDGTAGPYNFQIPLLSNVTPVPNNPPFQALLRGHVDMAGIIATDINVDPPLAVANALPLTGYALNLDIPVTSVNSAVYFTSIDSTGANVIVQDSGQFLPNNVNYGLLMNPGKAPLGNAALGTNEYSTTNNTINYLTGTATVTFPSSIPQGNNILAQCYFFQTGLPRMMLWYNNVITLRVPPAYQYLVELDAYLTPSAFFNTEQSIPFAYMAEYIARGAARKILSDTGDVEQFMFYEPLFKEQQALVWKRSQRQWTSTRTNTIYNQGSGNGTRGGIGYSGYGLS